MANRFPLVLDTTDGNKIKELPDSDNLDLRTNSIVNVQDITSLGTIDATVIKVNGQKLVAQAFADLTDTPSSFIGSPNYFVKVKADGTGLEYRPLSDLGNIEIDTITVDTSIVPSTTNVGNVGTEALKFNEIVATTLKGNLVSYNEEIVFDASTGKVSYASLQGAPQFLSEFSDDVGYLQTADLNAQIAGLFDEGVPFESDIKGSVFGDDSTVIVDGVAGKIRGDIEFTSAGSITGASNIVISAATTVDLGNTKVTGDIYPDTADTRSVGTTTNPFGEGHFDTMTSQTVVTNTLNYGTGLGIAEMTAATDLEITAGNRVKINGNVPFRLSEVSSTNLPAIAAENGDLIYNSTTNRVVMYQNGAWKDVNGNVEATAGTSNFNDVVIAGDLTITGDTTEIETTNTAITDNVIVLNKGETAAGVTLGTSGIEVERGTEANKTFVWDEATDKWTLGIETLVAATFEGNVTGSITGDTAGTHTGPVVGDVTGNAAGAHTGTFDGDMTGSVYADDSGILVDGVNAKIIGDIETASLRTSEDKIALGENTGVTNQAYGGIAIGPYAGTTDQDSQAVAVGTSAGRERQGAQATALGRYAGQNDQGVSAVAIGNRAGRESQGADAIAIGQLAGETNQATNSIVINATGVAVENTTVSSLVIKPVRDAVGTTVMMYNNANGEVTHTATPGTLAANIDQATVNIGATTATAINIGNSGSTTTIDGTVSFSTALVANNITADDSIQITTAVGANNGITLNPQGTDTSVNITADALRLFGTPVTDNIKAVGGLEGDLTGSVFGDDSAMLVNGLDSKLVGDIDSVNIHGQAFKADTIVNNTGTTLDLTAAGFLNIIGGNTDAGVSNIQMDKQGINHIELKTEPGNPTDPTDYARVAINAGTNEGDVRIGTPTSTRNQVVEVYNATVYGTLVGTIQGSIVGDVKGSIVADDSTVIIDGVAGKVLGPISKIVGDVQQISGPGEISLDTLVTEITTTATDDAYTLADGVVGQVKIIAMVGDAGDAILTPTTFANGTDITFEDVNDNITLLFTSNGWLSTANQGNPVIA
jgi:hypothetical protein|tara:strand:+ start:155 stop:3307 length:3153 start_codon:yes stop_codon:yes gene_type:complete